MRGLGEERGGKGELGVKNFFPHPNQLLIWAYLENLVKIRLLVEALDEFRGKAWQGREWDVRVQEDQALS